MGKQDMFVWASFKLCVNVLDSLYLYLQLYKAGSWVSQIFLCELEFKLSLML